MSARHVLGVSLLLSVVACGPKAGPAKNTGATQVVDAGASASETHAKWQPVASAFLAKYLQTYPVSATAAGEHKYDGNWPELANDDAERALYDETEKAIIALGDVKLDEQDAVDRDTLIEAIASARFSLDVLKAAEKDPLSYTGLLGEGLDALMSRTFATPEARMTSLASRLAGVPKIVAAAKARLKNPSKVHTETAIKQAEGLVAMVKKDVPAAAAHVPSQRAAVESAAKQAEVALVDLVKFMKTELLPRSNASFRIGKEAFEKKLAFALGDRVNAGELAKDARALLEDTQDKMFETAKELWPQVMTGAMPTGATRAEKKVVIRRVLDKLAESRPTSATILADATKLTADATAFVREHDLVRVPTEPCRIIEMPEHRRGVAIAYCDSSGPLEEKQETFYAISPTPKDWSPARTLSFYREYNNAMLADLTVHEAMPGHYLQAMHANTFKNDVRAVLGSGPFVEGWAVYAEWFMSEKGFGGPKVRMMRQKMLLRACANAILDHDIHAGAMEEKDALKLMIEETFQEEGEAVGKWKRARLTSAQLSTYFYGYREMMRLRADAEKKVGPGFSQRAYHDKLLSQGAPTMRQARMLFEAAKTPWGHT